VTLRQERTADRLTLLFREEAAALKGFWKEVIIGREELPTFTFSFREKKAPRRVRNYLRSHCSLT
jgi:hypothetical protein